MKLKVLSLTFAILALIFMPKAAKAMQFGVFIEDQSIIHHHDDNLLLNIDEVALSYSQNTGNKPNYKNLSKFDDELQQQEEFVETIGMFVSNYKSQRNFKVKVKLDSGTDIEKIQLNWKLKF